jgi:hypothetical protein
MNVCPFFIGGSAIKQQRRSTYWSHCSLKSPEAQEKSSSSAPPVASASAASTLAAAATSDPPAARGAIGASIATSSSANTVMLSGVAAINSRYRTVAISSASPTAVLSPVIPLPISAPPEVSVASAAVTAVELPATSVVASLPAPAVVQTGEDTMLPREDSSNSNNISSKLEVSSISHSLNKLSILIFLVGDNHDYLGSWKTST